MGLKSHSQLLKSFIGTGILFLGKACVPSEFVAIIVDFWFRFYNGGILFSFITLSLIALISLYSFILLVRTKFVVSGSFGGKLPSPIPPGPILSILVRTRWSAVREMD